VIGFGASGGSSVVQTLAITRTDRGPDGGEFTDDHRAVLSPLEAATGTRAEHVVAHKDGHAKDRAARRVPSPETS
jgi:hypothetical protein